MKLFTILLLIIPAFLFSQSHLLKVGEKGLLVSSGLSQSKMGNGFGFELAYSNSGVNEIGFSYVKNILKDGHNKDWDFYIASLRFHPRKQNKNRVLSPFISIAYVFVGSEIDISGFEVGAGAYKKFRYNENIEFMPVLSGAFSFLKASSGEHDVALAGTTGLMTGISTIFNLSDYHVIEIMPSLSLTEEATIYNINLNYSLKFN